MKCYIYAFFPILSEVNSIDRFRLKYKNNAIQHTYILCYRSPPDTYLAPLNPDHISRVDETWPYKHAASYFYFSTLAANNLVQGLHSTHNNQLVAWVFLNEYNFICHLYCEEQHRRKGYAEFLLKYTVNEQLTLGNDLYTYVEYDNERSSRLFDKLGFVNIDDGAYLFVQKLDDVST